MQPKCVRLEENSIAVGRDTRRVKQFIKSIAKKMMQENGGVPVPTKIVIDSNQTNQQIAGTYIHYQSHSQLALLVINQL